MNPSEQPLPLKGMALPPDIGWWPLAPGWWILMALIVLVLIAAFLVIRRMVQNRRHNPKREALKALVLLEKTMESQQWTTQEAAVACNTLLKRVALSLYPREQVASLSGKRWVTFLMAHTEKPVSSSELTALVDYQYQPKGDQPIDDTQKQQFIALTRTWINSAKERWQGV